MKTIQTFLAGKLRRAEVGDLLGLGTDGPPHPELGRLEARLESARGSIAFYERGLAPAGLDPLPYDDIARVALDPAARDALEILRTDGRRIRITGSPEGIDVIFAALRWIGHAILRRPLA